jgi:hypothetical protein
MTVTVVHSDLDAEVRAEGGLELDVNGKGADKFNEYIASHGQPVRCVNTSNKGRILIATKSFKQGDVVLTEAPLRVVQEQPDNPTYAKLKELCRDKDKYYDALWYWCALNSLTEADMSGCPDLAVITEREQEFILLLHHDPVRT